MDVTGWSLRSGGWPISFGKDNQAVPLDIPVTATAELRLDDVPVFLGAFAENHPSYRRDHQIRQLKPGDVVGFPSEIESIDPALYNLRLNGTGPLNLEIESC